MSSKVIHLSELAHEEAKQFCKSKGMRMSDWVSGLILRELYDDNGEPKVHTNLPDNIVPVEKKAFEGPAVRKDPKESIEGPPFWERGN